MIARKKPPPHLLPDAVIREWLPVRRLLEEAEAAPTAADLCAESQPLDPVRAFRPATTASPATRPASHPCHHAADSDEAGETWEDGHFSTEDGENPPENWDDGYDEDDDGCGTDHSDCEAMTCHCHCHCDGHCHGHCPCSADDPDGWEYGGDEADACRGCCHPAGDDAEDSWDCRCDRCHSEHRCAYDDDCQTDWDGAEGDEAEGCDRRSPFRRRCEAIRSSPRRRGRKRSRHRLTRALRLALMVKLLSLLRQKLRRRKRRRSRSPTALTCKRHQAQLRWLASVSAFLRRLKRQKRKEGREASADDNMSPCSSSRSDADHAAEEPPPSESAAGTLPRPNPASPDGTS